MRCLGDGWHGIGGGRRADRPGAPALEWAPRLIGDGTNLAHQVAHVFFGNAAGQILDRDDRGHVYVFRSTADRLGELTLADADVVIDGAGEVDGFGRLPVTPRLDINAGRHDDLLVGGAGIADLTGLGIATNLRHLNLTGNSVADLSELRSRTDLLTSVPLGLTRFDTLSLDFNQVADLTPLAGLTGLEFLSLDAQQPALAALDGLRPWWTCDG